MNSPRNRITALLALVLLGGVGLAMWGPGVDPESVRANGSGSSAENGPMEEVPLDLHITAPKQAETDVREEVRLTGGIEALLTMVDGTPLPGFEVRLLFEPEESTVEFSTEKPLTDEEGRARFEHTFPPGNVTVLANLLENTISSPTTIVAGETTQVHLTALAHSCYVWGIVTRNGVPQENRKVTLQGRDDAGVACFMPMMTDADGAYRIVVRHGTYAMGVAGGPGDFLIGSGKGTWYSRGNGPVAIWEDLTLGPSSPTVVRLDLDVPPTSVKLLVRDGNDGRGIADARVFLTRQGDPLPLYSTSTATLTTDDEGRVEFVDIPFGEYDLMVEASGLASPADYTVPIDASHMRHDLVLLLETGGTFEVDLIDEDGKLMPPPDHFRFTATHEATGATRLVHTRHGRMGSRYLQADHVALGTWTFEVRDEQHAGGIEFASYDPAGPFQVEVLEGERTTMEVKGLRERGRISIETMDGRGLMIRDEDIEVWTVGETPERVLLDHWDDPTIPSRGCHLPPGEYRIQVDWMGRRLERTITMTRDTRAEWFAFD